MKPPEDLRDETTSVNDEPLPGDASEHVDAPPAPVTIEEPTIVSYSAADFEAMLGSFNDLALYVVVGGDDDDDHHRPHPRVGRYERRDP